MIVADTDVLIHSLRGREPAMARIRLELGTGDLATTVINAFELLSGAKTEREMSRVQPLLDALTIVPMSERAARHAAAIRRELESKGEKIGMADYLIAAICLEHSAILLTGNRRHFERVKGLSLGRLS